MQVGSGARIATRWKISTCNLGQFLPCLADYRRINARKLGIISVFRDPLDRLVSSFFQSLSEEFYAYLEPDKAGDVSGREDSIIYKISASSLSGVGGNDRSCL